MFFNRYLLIICVVCCCEVLNCYSQVTQKLDTNQNFIRYIKLPDGMTNEDVFSSNEKIEMQLYNYSKLHLNLSAKNKFLRYQDLIVIFTDLRGKSILSAKKTSAQGSRISATTGNEITYTFNSPNQPWSPSQLDSLKKYVDVFYPQIKDVIGNPLFNDTVNIVQDSTLGNYAGLYYAGLNEIILWKVAPDAFVHESIHAFRNKVVMGLSAYEEGMTRAAEVEVFNRVPAYTHWDESHSYDYDVFYDGLNRPDIASYQGYIGSYFALDLLKYQLSSYVWAKAYIEDNAFFKRFNDSLYIRQMADPATISSESSLRDIFQTIKSSVENVPTSTWYDKQFVLNTGRLSPGYKLYQRINSYTIDYFYTDSSGRETPQAGQTVSWELFDYNNQLLGSGSKVSQLYGWIYFDPPVSTSYYGRVKVIAHVQSPQGMIIDSEYRAQLPYGTVLGLFGDIAEQDTGTVMVTPLDTLLGTLVTHITNGAFTFPEIQNIRGRFRFDYVYPDASRVSKVYTKDRSQYFISITKDMASTPIVTPVYFKSFEVSCFNSQTHLDWSTVFEPANTFFEVQKSGNDNIWNTIGIVAGNVNSSSNHEYQYSDVENGDDYYRVRLVSQEKSEYTAIRRAYCLTALGAVIYPVPAQNDLNMDIKTDISQQIQVQIYDLIGRIVKEQVLWVNKGFNHLHLDISALLSGAYIIRCKNDPSLLNKKFIITK